MFDALSSATMPTRIRLRRENTVPSQELLKLSPISVSCSPHSYVLLESQVLGLMTNSLVLPVVSLLGLIGLDATNVVWSALHELTNQLISLGLEGLNSEGLNKGGRKGLNKGGEKG